MEYFFMRHKATSTPLVDKRGFLQVYRRTPARNPHWHSVKQLGHQLGWERVALTERMCLLAHSQFAEQLPAGTLRLPPGKATGEAAGVLRLREGDHGDTDHRWLLCKEFPGERYYQVDARDGVLTYELVYLAGGYVKVVKVKPVTERQMRDDQKLGDGRFLWGHQKLALTGQDPDNVARNELISAKLQELRGLDLSAAEMRRVVEFVHALTPVGA